MLSVSIAPCSLAAVHSAVLCVALLLAADAVTALGPQPQALRGYQLHASAAAQSGPGVVVETLRFTIPCTRVPAFVAADHEVWTKYLQGTAPFLFKQVWSNPEQAGDANCTVWSVIHWRSRSAWKALPAATLNKVQAAFVAAYGGDPAPVELPTAEGYDVVNSTGPCVHDSAPAVVEMLQFNLPCANVSAFVRADHQVWTTYLEQTAPFQYKEVWRNPEQSQGVCSVWSVIHWASRTAWKALPAPVLARVQAQFVEVYGADPVPVLHPAADGNGFNVVTATKYACQQ